MEIDYSFYFKIFDFDTALDACFLAARIKLKAEIIYDLPPEMDINSPGLVTNDFSVAVSKDYFIKGALDEHLTYPYFEC
jgi:hypothetical protein